MMRPALALSTGPVLALALLWGLMAVSGCRSSTADTAECNSPRWWALPGDADCASPEPEPEQTAQEEPPAEATPTEPQAVVQEAPAEPAAVEPVAAAEPAPAEPATAAESTPEAPPAPAAPLAPEPEPPFALVATPEPPSRRAKIDWGREFKSWDAVTGYVLSASHGNRMVQTYIYPAEAARIYKHNATLARQRKDEGFQSYPPGTHIVQESWLRNERGGPGQAGPVFFLRKESPGHDPAGGDWHYAMTRDDLTLVGEGRENRMLFCRECHARAAARDYVYATER